MNSGQPMRSALAVDHFNFIDRVQQGSHLRQGDLRPDHVLARPAADTVLGADPELAIRGGRVDQHDVHRLLGARRGQQSLADDLVRVGEIHLAQLGSQAASHIDRFEDLYPCHSLFSLLT